MTEQSKIPVPEKGDQPGKTDPLLQRSLGEMDFGRFKPAPVPQELIEEADRRAKAKQAAKAPAEEPEAHVPVTAPAQLKTAPAVPQPQTEVAPPRKLEKPVDLPTKQVPVDRSLLADHGMIVPEGPVTEILEEFRIVKRQVLQAIGQAQASGDTSGKAQRVLVCSPHPGEGKTFCAVNLALATAGERDTEVVLVDADLAKPSVLSTLGLPAGEGLMDAIVDPSVMVEDCVIRTDIAGLFVLPAGNQTEADSEYLASTRTARVLDRLTRGAPNRVIIFDSPPALAASPAAELAKHVGQALMIARADRTGQSALEDAVQLLSNCPDIKLLLNGAHFSPSGRRFGSYYGYGG